jgi:hypothetical protein
MTGLSPTTITRLTATWEGEYHAWRRRDLHEAEYVYVWVDGVHFRVRLEEDRLCTLVMIGARAAPSYPLSRSFAVGARPTREADANSCGEVTPRQQLAQLMTVEKNRCILVIGPEGVVAAISARIFGLVGTISGTVVGTTRSA